MLADLETVQKDVLSAPSARRRTTRRPRSRVATRCRRCCKRSRRGSRRAASRSMPREAAELRDLHLLTAKPVMYIANVAEGSPADNPLVARVQQPRRGTRRRMRRDLGGDRGRARAARRKPSAPTFSSSLGLDEPGLNRVIRSAYRLLGLKTFYTAGPKEVRAWTVPRNATAPEAAGAIHTDFQRGFIRAEVIGYDQFIAAARRARREGGWRATARRQDLRRPGRRRDLLSLQRLRSFVWSSCKLRLTSLIALSRSPRAAATRSRAAPRQPRRPRCLAPRHRHHAAAGLHRHDLRRRIGSAAPHRGARQRRRVRRVAQRRGQQIVPQDSEGGVAALRDTNGDGRADLIERFGRGDVDTGLAIHDDTIYFSSAVAVYALPLTDELVPTGEPAARDRRLRRAPGAVTPRSRLRSTTRATSTCKPAYRRTAAKRKTARRARRV